jgi:P4 family phage/plasmid primase-like protien
MASPLSNFSRKYQIFRDKDNKADDVKASHTQITGGSYLIPLDKLDEFHELYAKELETGKKLYFLEAPRRDIDYGYVKVDFDFRYPLETPNRQYTKTHVKNIVKVYRDLIKKYFVTDEADLTCYVTERSEPVKRDNENTIGDGFHLLFTVGLPYSFQHVLRNMVIEKIVKDKIIDDIKTLNSIQDVIDKSVVESNNWFVYGSRKLNKEPYLLTMELDNINDEQDLDKWSMTDLVKTLSIRCVGDRLEYRSEDLENEIKAKAPIKIKNTQKIKEKKAVLEKLNKNSLPENHETIRSLVRILSPERAEHYPEWFAVGACLYNINEDDLLPVWIEFSKQSPKFKEGVCEEFWSKYRKDNLGLPSLMFWAKTDNPTEYEKIRHNSVEYKMELSVKTPTHYDIAAVVYEMYRYDFVCTSIKYKNWYYFDGNHWCYSDQGMCIRSILSKEVAIKYNEYIHTCTTKVSKFMAEGNDTETKKWEDYRKTASKIASNLKTTSYKDNVVKESAEFFYDKTFMLKLDTSPLLIGTQNGVYDLAKREFRQGRPDDYISKKVSVNYIDIDKKNPDHMRKLDFIHDFFNKVLPIESVRKYMWLTISSALEGYTTQRFPILTGTGGNGKTILMEFLQETFGEYACTVSTSIFTHKSGSPSAASPEIARIQNVRLVSAEETEEGSTINVARMKELTGGNKITSRKLFEDITEFKPQAHWFLVCNNLPKITSDDGGTWRRIHIVEFISSFVDNPNDEKYDGQSYIFPRDDEIGIKLADCREILFSYLANTVYPEFKKCGIKEPREIEMKTTDYRQENDMFFQYIKDRVDKKADGILKISEAYGDFKYWFKDSGIDMKIPSNKEFKTYFDRKFGSYGNHRNGNAGWKGITIKPREIDLDTPAPMEEKDI